MNTMEGVQVDKKLKMDSVLEIDNQMEIEVEDKRTTINDLPPEMLKEILKHLDVKNLLICRLVNRKWNGITSEILRSRTDAEIQIDIKEYNTDLRIHEAKNSFKEFIKCFNDSKDFPFTRFCRYRVKNSTFDDEDWTKFLVDFGENIKCLKILINPNSSTRRFIKLVEKLKDLLLNQLPFLDEFGLLFERDQTATEVQLFPKLETDQPKIQLPHIKVLHLDHSFSKCTGIVTDLLEASVNLQKIEFNCRIYGSITDFMFFQSQGKLQYLQGATIKLTPELLTKIKENPKVVSEFKLRELKLDLKPLYKSKQGWSDAAIFLSEIFESCKDTLKEITSSPLGFLNDLQLPKFSKLTSLRIEDEDWSFRGVVSPPSIFSGGIKPLDVFPVLSSLVVEITWSFDFLHPECIGTPCFPNLKTLKFDGEETDGQTISQISKLCPNLKSLTISSDYESINNFPDVGTAIWTHMKKLQSLYLKIDVGSDDNAFPAIDSCITGISKEDCQRLYDLNKAARNLKKWGSGVNIPKSELEVERKNVSILDLKDLKNLEILLWMWLEPTSAPIRDLTNKALTSVSEDYALKLMDNLTYKIERDLIVAS